MSTVQYDVLAVYVTATGALGTSGRCRVKSVYYVSTAGGTLTFRDGSASGPIRLQLATAASGVGLSVIPGEGILFQGDPHLTITGTASVTVFYG
jgi:hypothetical protein